MTTEVSAPSTLVDKVKIGGAILLLLGAILAFYSFPAVPVAYRILGLLLVTGVALFVFFSTAIGAQLWTFVVASRNELKRVVWPSRQETFHTTLIVLFMVLIVAIFLWLVDMLLKWLVGLLIL